MIWLTVKEVSELMNISISGVKKAVYSNRFTYHYEDGVGRGGKQLLISLESLPQETQDRYNGKNVEKEPELLIERYALTQIKEAEYEASIVLDFQRSGVSADKFIQDFNRKNNRPVRKLQKWCNLLYKAQIKEKRIENLRCLFL